MTSAVVQPVKQVPTFYGIRTFITVLPQATCGKESSKADRLGQFNNENVVSKPPALSTDAVILFVRCTVIRTGHSTCYCCLRRSCSKIMIFNCFMVTARLNCNSYTIKTINMCKRNPHFITCCGPAVPSKCNPFMCT